MEWRSPARTPRARRGKTGAGHGQGKLRGAGPDRCRPRENRDPHDLRATPQCSHATVVAVRPPDDGGVEIELAKDALAVRLLLARPLASVRVAAEACEPVLLHGAACRLPGLSEQGLVRFRLHAAVVRVGTPATVLDEAAHAAAEPDPLRHDAPHVLAHLNAGHADALATSLRASRHDAAFARATRLDAGGLTGLAVHDGASTPSD